MLSAKNNKLIVQDEQIIITITFVILSDTILKMGQGLVSSARMNLTHHPC